MWILSQITTKAFQIPKHFIRDISRHHISFWVSTKYFPCLTVNIWTWGWFLTHAFALVSAITYANNNMFIFFYHSLLKKPKAGYWFLQIHTNLQTVSTYAVTVVIMKLKPLWITFQYILHVSPKTKNYQIFSCFYYI